MSQETNSAGGAGGEPAAGRRGTMLSAIGGSVLESGDGYARGVLPLSEAVMQPTRVFHAGAIVTLADEVASAAIYGGGADPKSLGGTLFPYSIQISVNLLTNDPKGPLTAESKVVKRGRATVVETEVTTHEGKLAALMRSVHLMVDLRRQGPHERHLVADND